jgi:hypothetical protein
MDAVYEHFNLLGRYAFSVPEGVQRRELQPLRSPSDCTEEVAESLSEFSVPLSPNTL